MFSVDLEQVTKESGRLFFARLWKNHFWILVFYCDLLLYLPVAESQQSTQLVTVGNHNNVRVTPRFSGLFQNGQRFIVWGQEIFVVPYTDLEKQSGDFLLSLCLDSTGYTLRGSRQSLKELSMYYRTRKMEGKTYAWYQGMEKVFRIFRCSVTQFSVSCNNHEFLYFHEWGRFWVFTIKPFLLPWSKEHREIARTGHYWTGVGNKSRSVAAYNWGDPEFWPSHQIATSWAWSDAQSPANGRRCCRSEHIA